MKFIILIIAFLSTSMSSQEIQDKYTRMSELVEMKSSSPSAAIHHFQLTIGYLKNLSKNLKAKNHALSEVDEVILEILLKKLALDKTINQGGQSVLYNVFRIISMRQKQREHQKTKMNVKVNPKKKLKYMHWRQGL